MKRFALFAIAAVFALYAALACSVLLERKVSADERVNLIAAASMTHGCPLINPDDFLTDCYWDLLWSPSNPYVYCPEGFDPECRAACLNAWDAAIESEVGHALSDISACCEAYNDAIMYAAMVYDTDVAAAEAAFQSCTQSAARCEYLYCQAIAAAEAAFTSAKVTAAAAKTTCILAARTECIEEIEDETLTCIACMEECCY